MRCNLCLEFLCDAASRHTDELYLKNINGRDYLVCEYHLNGGTNEKSNSRDVVTGV
jgi:hypothetical protein